MAFKGSRGSTLGRKSHPRGASVFNTQIFSITISTAAVWLKAPAAVKCLLFYPVRNHTCPFPGDVTTCFSTAGQLMHWLTTSWRQNPPQRANMHRVRKTPAGWSVIVKVPVTLIQEVKIVFKHGNGFVVLFSCCSCKLCAVKAWGKQREDGSVRFIMFNLFINQSHVQKPLSRQEDGPLGSRHLD